MKLIKLLLTLTLVITLVGCGSSNEPNNETGNDETVSYLELSETYKEEILASIEADTSKTGTLIVVSPNSNGEINILRPAFEKKYPNVKLEIISLGTGDCLSRIAAEVNNPTIDIMWGGLNYEKWFNNQGYWQQYVSENEKNITVDAAKSSNQKDGAGYYTSYGLSGNTAFIINTQVLEELGLSLDDITGYQSLIDHKDKLKGQVLSGDPVKSSSAWQELVTMLYCYSNGFENGWENLEIEKGWDYVTEFIDVIDGTVLSSSSAVYKNVIAGEAAIGVTYEDPALQAVKDETENITMIYPKEGNNWTPCAAAIIKDAKNMDNAKLFIDFLLSDEVQKLYTCTTLRSVVADNENIVEGFKKLSQIDNVFDQDMTIIAKQSSDWKAKWTDLLNSYSK